MYLLFLYPEGWRKGLWKGKAGGKVATSPVLGREQLNSLEGLGNILEYRVELKMFNIHYVPLPKELGKAIIR